MFDVDFDPIAWTTRIIHENATDDILAEGYGIVAIIHQILSAAVAASGYMIKTCLIR